MSKKSPDSGTRQNQSTLVVRKTVRASAERLFKAWTNAKELQRWWGTKEIVCIAAEIDLRVGGAYRIGNKLPDGKLLWITGEFEIIEPPKKLVFTWRVEPETKKSERVTVRFEAQGTATEVVITHERIPNAAARNQHEYGWRGCLDGLARYAESD
jgi:uncharacterized protein YndB with AHSA1/START domain